MKNCTYVSLFTSQKAFMIMCWWFSKCHINTNKLGLEKVVKVGSYSLLLLITLRTHNCYYILLDTRQVLSLFTCVILYIYIVMFYFSENVCMHINNFPFLVINYQVLKWLIFLFLERVVDTCLHWSLVCFYPLSYLIA